MTAPVQAHCLVVTSAAAFFALVDRHVTGPMEAAGYVKIGEYDEVTDSARALPLIAARPQWLAAWPRFRESRLVAWWTPHPRSPKERVHRVGYEGVDERGEDDEKWLDHFPATEELAVLDWGEELGGHADWDVWTDRAVPTAEELEHRLRVLGEAMRRPGPDGQAQGGA